MNNNFEAFSFPNDWTEEQKIQVYNELNEHYDVIERDYEKFLEEDNEARQAYNSMIQFWYGPRLC